MNGGLLTVELPEGVVEEIWVLTEADPTVEITVDLTAQEVRFGDRTAPFELDPYARWRLLEGLDDIGLTLRHADDIADFESNRADWLPTTVA